MLLADGVPAQVGMKVYVLYEGQIRCRTIREIYPGGRTFEYNRVMGKHYGCRTGFAYSNKKAAEAGYRMDGLL